MTEACLSEKDSEHKQVARRSSDKRATPGKLSRQQATFGNTTVEKSPRLVMPLIAVG